MPRLIHGHYQSTAGNADYEYDAIWRELPAGLTWNATVRTTQPLPLTLFPGGTMRGSSSLPGEAVVRLAIGKAIDWCVSGTERRVSVR